MVKYLRKDLGWKWKKNKEYSVDEDEDPLGLIFKIHVCCRRIAKPKCFYFIFLALACSCLILTFLIYYLGINKDGFTSGTDVNGLLCSAVLNGTICCDRTSIRTDICVMKGDVRTHSLSSSIILYKTDGSDDSIPPKSGIHREKIKPYTRKWETSVMNTIQKLNLIVIRNSTTNHHTCDVLHEVPALFFSTGGYTGNLYHEFNDGILPLYITSQHLNKKVVFVILEYHNWWITKYGDILSQLSEFPPVDFNEDKRVHCFPEAIIGLRIHDELSIDASKMEGNKTYINFHNLLDSAYRPRIRGLIEDEERENLATSNSSLLKKMETRDLTTKPKLVIVSRNGSRAITNEDLLVKVAKEIGFVVEVLRPEKTTELAITYRVLNSSDVMVGVHGAAMTHFLFMNPNSIFIQIIPLGTDWAAETYFGEPTVRYGLRYIGYKIRAYESSLYDDYDKNDPILMDPSSVNRKGWEFTKRIYLDRQVVRLDLRRFRKRLLHAYYYTLVWKNSRRSDRVRE